MIIGVVVSLSRKGFLLTVVIAFYPTFLLISTLKNFSFYNYNEWTPYVFFFIFFLISFYIIKYFYLENDDVFESAIFEHLFLGTALAILTFTAIIFLANPAISPLLEMVFVDKYTFFHYAIPLALIYLSTR